MEKEAIHDIMKSRYEVMHNISKRYVMTSHFHEHYEIYFSISGGKYYFVGDQVYDIKPGDVFLVPCNVIHKVVASQDEVYERYIVVLQPEYFKFLLSEGTQLLDCLDNCSARNSYKIVLTSTQQKHLKEYFEKFKKLNGYGSDVLELTVILEILIYINQLLNETNETNEKNEIDIDNINKQNTIISIISYIEKNFAEHITLKKLSAQMFLSEHYLCKIFHKNTGTTINRYIIQRRITEAKRLLNQGMRVNNVCEKVGFNDYSHFIRTFKAVTGVSPSRYK